ncbi:MAG: carboxypeptidase-like regulatory domain-containing protein [Reichenbachiella sp.]
MKYLVFNLFLILAPLVSFSSGDKPVLVTGRIIDKATNEPLPFANIIYEQKGTSSNIDGEFVMLIENHNDESELLVKFIGYESQKFDINKRSKNLEVKLERSTQFLENLTVYSAEEILKDVHNYRQINYEYEDQQLSTYYKESVNSPKNCIYLAEGIFDIFLPTIYSKEDTKIQVKKTRKKEFYSLDSLGIPMFNGHASDMIQSATRREDSFLDRSEMGNYVYSKEDVTEYDGKEVYKIKFEPRNRKGTAKGTLYIDVESKAIIKAEYYPVLENQYFWTNVMWTEEYIEIDGTWYIHRVSYAGSWDHFGETFTYDALMVVTDFDKKEDSKQVANALDDQAIFFHEASSFSENFWEDHNYIKLSLKEKSSLVQVEH